MKERYRTTILVLVLLWVAILALPALAQEAPPGLPGCPLTDGLVLNAQGEAWNVWFLRSDLALSDAQTGGDGAVPAGRYNVVLAAWDGHSPDGPTQLNEQWLLQGLSGGVVVFTSGATPDVADDANLVVATVSADVQVPAFTQVRALHAAFPNDESPNSVWPLCAAFVPVPADVQADLAVSVTMPDASLDLGEEPATFDVVVTNDGPDTGESVVAMLPLPTGFTLVSVAPVAGTCTETAGAISCDLGSMATGDTVEIQVVAEPSVFGAFVFEVSASSSTADPDLVNNVAEVAFNVVDVLPQVITTTTAAPTTTAASVETLPFTGTSTTGPGGTAVGLILLGGLVLLVSSPRLWYKGKHR
jgi:uncharacterized repeat protein (TIGR01451 family)